MEPRTKSLWEKLVDLFGCMDETDVQHARNHPASVRTPLLATTQAAAPAGNNPPAAPAPAPAAPPPLTLADRLRLLDRKIDEGQILDVLGEIAMNLHYSRANIKDGNTNKPGEDPATLLADGLAVARGKRVHLTSGSRAGMGSNFAKDGAVGQLTDAAGSAAILELLITLGVLDANTTAVPSQVTDRLTFRWSQSQTSAVFYQGGERGGTDEGRATGAGQQSGAAQKGRSLLDYDAY